MNRLLLWWIRFGVLSLWLVPAIGLTQGKEKVEVPQGYEDAATAEAQTPDAEIAEEDSGSLIDVLVGALAEDADPQVAALVGQFLPQFQTILKSELAFFRRACHTSNDQYDDFAKAAQQRLWVAVREYALAQNRLRRGRVGGGRLPTLPDPRRLVEQQLTNLVKEKLNTEQREAYQRELDKRIAHRKRAAVWGLVAGLDEQLVLTAEQRKQLIESLSSNWQDAWYSWLEVLMNNNEYIPNIPDQYVVPFLNETQKVVWRGQQKQGVIMGGGFGFGPAMVMIDDGEVQ